MAYDPTHIEFTSTLDAGGASGAYLDAVAHEVERDLRVQEALRGRRGWVVRRMLLVADVAGLLSAVALERVLVGAPLVARSLPVEFGVLAAALPFWTVAAKIYGLYDRDEERTDHSTVDEVVGLFHLVTVGVWTFFVLARIAGSHSLDVGRLMLFWVLAIITLALARAGARTLSRRRTDYVQNTLIVGTDSVAGLIARKILRHGEYGINPVGFVETGATARETPMPLPVLGVADQLPQLIDRYGIERVIVAFPDEGEEWTEELIRLLRDLDVQVDIAPRLLGVIGPNVRIHALEGMPLVGLPRLRLSRSSTLLKRVVDVTFSVLGLVLLSPLFLFAALAIKATSRGPVFFRQLRMGANHKTFTIYKFRTMVADADERKHEVAHLNMHLAPGGDPRMFKVRRDPRITAIGRFLRRYSLDELPQLINVIKGEMSLVGPRPLILDEHRYVERWAKRRLDLKPGLTGLWQVLGRSEIPFEEMVKLDYLYVTGWSLSGDLRLIAQTIPALFRSREAT